MTPIPAFEDKAFTVVLDVELQANQTTEPIAVQLDKDADFWWSSIGVSYSGLPFGVTFKDSTEYQLSDDFLSSCMLASNVGVGVPYTMYPPIWFPAGSSIIATLQEQSGHPNVFQMIFIGIKRFAVKQ